MAMEFVPRCTVEVGRGQTGHGQQVVPLFHSRQRRTPEESGDEPVDTPRRNYGWADVHISRSAWLKVCGGPEDRQMGRERARIATRVPGIMTVWIMQAKT